MNEPVKREGWDCSKCGSIGTVYTAKDSRWHGEGADRQKRRRRQCKSCGQRFTTIEVLETRFTPRNLSKLRQLLVAALTELGSTEGT